VGILVVLLALTVGLVLYDAVRRPSLRRLAVRNIVRRPGEATLVVLGAMLGTAIICTSFIVGDTFGQSIRNIAPAKLGEVDIDVSANKPEQLVPAIAAADAGSLKGIDGSLTLYSIGATVATPGSDPGRLAEPFSTILELDFDAARHFGSDVGNTGFADAGASPAGN
jgi:putative ABC transport system permease protein